MGGGSGSLGPRSGNYEGTYQISATGEEVVSNVFSTTSQALNNGATFDLTRPVRGWRHHRYDRRCYDTPQGIVDAINASPGIPGITAALLADVPVDTVSRFVTPPVWAMPLPFLPTSRTITPTTMRVIRLPRPIPTGFNDLANRKQASTFTEISLTLPVRVLR